MSANGTNTMTLREVALRLARLPGSLAGKIDDGKLLSLLKSGELKAGFFSQGTGYFGFQFPPTTGPPSAVTPFVRFADLTMMSIS
jgi:hypothetical protein